MKIIRAKLRVYEKTRANIFSLLSDVILNRLKLNLQCVEHIFHIRLIDFLFLKPF